MTEGVWYFGDLGLLANAVTADATELVIRICDVLDWSAGHER